MKLSSVTIQMKTTEQYFPVVLFIMCLIIRGGGLGAAYYVTPRVCPFSTLRDWSKSTGGGWAGAEGGWVTMFSALPMGWVMLF